jgi:uncharacterized membrane protein YsdA (DUF1294 family)
MEKDEAPPFTSDKEAEFLLKEYEALRAQITSHIASQTQLTTITIVLLGGAIATTPFLLSSDSQGLHLRFPPIYFVLVLLVTSTLFTSLVLASMGHDIQMASMAQYFYRNVRMRASSLLGGSTGSVFNWDRYRIGLMFPTFNKSRPLLSTMR